MNFKSLDYFITLVNQGTFTKASTVLNVTQQTLSAHIASLEEEFGCQLVVRHIPVELTYAGELFLKYAKDLQFRVRNMRNDFLDISQNKRGMLRVGIGHTRGRAIMPDLIAAFQKVHPGIEILIIEDTNDNLVRKLHEGKVDFSISDFANKVMGIRIMDIYVEKVALFLPKTLLSDIYGEQTEEVVRSVRETGTVTALASCPFLMNSEHDIAGRFARLMLQKSDIYPMIKTETINTNIELLIAMCLQGSGALFCQEAMANTVLSPEQQEKLIKINFDDSANYTVRLGYKEESTNWNAVRDFIEVTRQLDFGKKLIS